MRLVLVQHLKGFAVAISADRAAKAHAAEQIETDAALKMIVVDDERSQPRWVEGIIVNHQRARTPRQATLGQDA